MSVPKIWRNIPGNYALIGKKCCECSQLFFPKRAVCNNCGSTEMQDYKFSGKGKIYTFTHVRSTAKDPEGDIKDIQYRDTPYCLAIIELEEGPRLTAEIVDSDEIGIGKEVEHVFRRLNAPSANGVIQYGYKFRIVR